MLACRGMRAMASVPLARIIARDVCRSSSFSRVRALSSSPHLRCKNPEKNVNSFSSRTHTCGELRVDHVGQDVKLVGWLHYRRLDLFVVLRDIYGLVQICMSQIEGNEADLLQQCCLESVVEVCGTVIHRPDRDVNPRMATGGVEVVPSSVRVLNTSLNVPFNISAKKDENLPEYIRLKHRYLDLRSDGYQDVLKFRSALTNRIRQYLTDEFGFLEVETPTLFRRSPGGAREYIVPTREENKFYSLVQSPQQFKQMLMCGGMDRYFQFARCYRDESGTPQRQPEFTQLDLELSFTSQADIISLVERFICHSWPETSWPNLPAVAAPFPQMTHAQAMLEYGCDKPDTRFDMKICDLTGGLLDCEFPPVVKALSTQQSTVRGIRVPNGNSSLAGKEKLSLEAVARDAGLVVFSVRLTETADWQAALRSKMSAKHRSYVDDQLGSSASDLLIVVGGPRDAVASTLGRIRLQCADLLQSHGVQLYSKKDFKFLWVHTFPLFDQGKEGLESSHHPFTAPHPDDLALLDTDPLKVRAQHFDLVLNGVEIGGGSIRIHDSELQRKILLDLLKLDLSDFKHLLSMLSYGCPPHGGLALGFDRYLAVLSGRESIRDVIAFPKQSSGHEPMTDAPYPLSATELEEYFLQVVPDKTKELTRSKEHTVSQYDVHR